MAPRQGLPPRSGPTSRSPNQREKILNLLRERGRAGATNGDRWATGIQPSRMSLIENEHVEPTEHELEAIERFLASVQQRSHDAQVLRSEVGASP